MKSISCSIARRIFSLSRSVNAGRSICSPGTFTLLRAPKNAFVLYFHKKMVRFLYLLPTYPTHHHQIRYGLPLSQSLTIDHVRNIDIVVCCKLIRTTIDIYFLTNMILNWFVYRCSSDFRTFSIYQ